MNEEEPPDDWDDISQDDPTQTMDARATALRTAWINAVRNHHLRRNGSQSSYNSKLYWDGGYDHKLKKNYKPKWPQFVAKADSMGIDPIVLVEVLFSSVISETVPRADAIIGPENVTRYMRHKPARAGRVMNAVKTEESIFRTAVWAAGGILADPKAAVPYVLNDHGRQLSPLFRYCMALLVNRPDIAKRWTTPALEQFGADIDSYRRYWSHLLPADLTAQPVEGSAK